MRGARSFAINTERVLVYSQDEYNLTGCVFHTRDYIRNEIEKSKGKIVLSDINKALGTATNGGGVASACFSLGKTEPTMVTEDMYVKLQSWCSPYLRKEYEELRKEYEELRRPFNNYMKLTEVLDFSMETEKTSKWKHPTMKPPQLCSALIRTCSRKGMNMLVPFGGSGSECIEGYHAGLNVVACELDKEYYDLAQQRILEETAQQSFL